MAVVVVGKADGCAVVQAGRFTASSRWLRRKATQSVRSAGTITHIPAGMLEPQSKHQRRNLLASLLNDARVR